MKKGLPEEDGHKQQPTAVADLSLPCTFAASTSNARMIHGIIPWDKGHEAPAGYLGTAMRKATRTEQVLLLQRWRGASSLIGIT